MKLFRTDHGLAWALALLVWFPLIGGAAMWLFVGSVAYWVKHGWLPAHTEGWVQAIGSLLALVVAIGVPLLLKLQERATARRAKKQQQQAAYFQLSKLVEQIQYLLAPTDIVLLQDSYGDGHHAAYLYLLNIAKRLDEIEASCVDQCLMTFTHAVRVEVFRFVQHLEPRDNCSEYHRHRLKVRVDELARDIQAVIAAVPPLPPAPGSAATPVVDAAKPPSSLWRRICDDLRTGLFFLIFSIAICVGIELSQQNNNLNCFLNSLLNESFALKTFMLLLILQMLFVGLILQFKACSKEWLVNILMSPARVGRPVCVSSGAMVLGLVIAGLLFGYSEMSLGLLGTASVLFPGAWISFLVLEWYVETNATHKDNESQSWGKGLVVGFLILLFAAWVLIQRGTFLDTASTSTCEAPAVVKSASLPTAAN